MTNTSPVSTRVAAVSIACIAAALIASVSLGAQTRAGGNIRTVAPDGPVPRLADGKPDLTGVWLGGAGYGNIESVLRKGDTISLLPEAKKMMAARKMNEDPGANCLPITVPRGTPYPWRMVTTPTHLFFLYEMYNYRQVFMDGRPHPAADDLVQSWNGHSVGHWEGDTVVIDTVGYNDKGWFDSRGHPRTEKLHTIERFTRTNLGTMQIEVTIDDPGAYAKPFTLSFAAKLMPTGELIEYICEENNQDVPHIEGLADRTQGGGN